MAYTLEAAYNELTRKLGKFNKAANNWRYGSLVSVRYMHSPISNIPILRHFFEYYTEQPGNKRTPNVAIMFDNVPAQLQYKVLAGSTFRMVNDLADEGQVQLVTDVGSEMTSLFSSNRLSMNKEWMAGRYIRIPTEEMED